MKNIDNKKENRKQTSKHKTIKREKKTKNKNLHLKPQ